MPAVLGVSWCCSDCQDPSGHDSNGCSPQPAQWMTTPSQVGTHKSSQPHPVTDIRVRPGSGPGIGQMLLICDLLAAPRWVGKLHARRCAARTCGESLRTSPVPPCAPQCCALTLRSEHRALFLVLATATGCEVACRAPRAEDRGEAGGHGRPQRMPVSCPGAPLRCVPEEPTRLATKSLMASTKLGRSEGCTCSSPARSGSMTPRRPPILVCRNSLLLPLEQEYPLRPRLWLLLLQVFIEVS